MKHKNQSPRGNPYIIHLASTASRYTSLLGGNYSCEGQPYKNDYVSFEAVAQSLYHMISSPPRGGLLGSTTVRIVALSRVSLMRYDHQNSITRILPHKEVKTMQDVLVLQRFEPSTFLIIALEYIDS